MINRSFRCPDCGHVETVTLPSEAWDDEPPDCPVCTSADYHQEFKAPGVLTVRSQAMKIAERNAEAQEAHQRETGIKAAEDAMAAENFTKEAKRIVEHARELNQVQPMMTDTGIGRTTPVPINSPMMAAAVASSRAERNATGMMSPAEALITSIKSGKAPDMFQAFRRNCDRVS